MRGSRKFFQRGSNFFILVNGWIEIPLKSAIHGPPAKRHLNGVSLTCLWWPNTECWLGSFVIFQVIRTSIAKKPYIFAMWSPVLPLCLKSLNFDSANMKCFTVFNVYFRCPSKMTWGWTCSRSVHEHHVTRIQYSQTHRKRIFIRYLKFNPKNKSKKIQLPHMIMELTALAISERSV